MKAYLEGTVIFSRARVKISVRQRDGTMELLFLKVSQEWPFLCPFLKFTCSVPH